MKDSLTSLSSYVKDEARYPELFTVSGTSKLESGLDIQVMIGSRLSIEYLGIYQLMCTLKLLQGGL